MLCQHCKKREATFNHVEIINGEACELHLCDVCAAYKFGDFEASVAGAIISGLFGEDKREEKVCPACGMRFSDYERGGLLGCPSCYDLFKEELMPYIARIQGKTEHVGKGGGGYSAEHELRSRLLELQNKLDEALKKGNSVEAGMINERLNAIKRRLSVGKKWRT